MKIRLLATSDVHGFISPYLYSDGSLAEQSLSRLSAHIRRLRDENTLLIDNGDVLQGSPLNTYHQRYAKEKIHPMALALNALEYDYYNLGNHDFNYGLPMLHRYMQEVHAECLTGNLVENEEPLGADYTIHYFDEQHCIALIGVTTQYIPHWEQPKNIAGISFENALEYVQKTVDLIRSKEQVDGIVVVYHGGFEKDLLSGQETEALTGENLGYQMCQIEGVDVIISGHQHRSLATVCNGKTVTQTASNGRELAVIEWDLETHAIHAELLKANQPVDETLLELIREEEEKTQQWLDQPLGRLKEGDLLVRDELKGRIHKHPLISFLNQVQREFGQADLSSQALFNGARGFNQEITMRDLVASYMFPNTLVTLKISGKILKEFLEKSAEYFSVRDGKIVVSDRYLAPKPQHYNYDMVDGVEYTIKVSNPIGQRIVELKRNGVEVKQDDQFTIAMSNYRASGGGDFMMLQGCEVVQDHQKDMVECLAEYLLAHPILTVDHKENIRVII